MIVTNVCSVFSFKCQIIHKTATTNMLGNKLLLRITWVNSIFERFIHNLFITKTIPIYTNQTKCQNYLKCKCKRSRLHPTEPIGISGFYAPTYKASQKNLQKITDIEKFITQSIEIGVIQNEKHLMTVINKYKIN